MQPVEVMKNSVFPHFKDFTENIERKGRRTIVKKNHENAKDFYLRKLPKEEDDPLFKSDRQARVCITETRAGVVNAVIVQNLGDDQTTFQIMGPKAKAYLNACIDFYRNCQFVEWKEIKELYEKYDRRQKEKMESSENDY